MDKWIVYYLFIYILTSKILFILYIGNGMGKNKLYYKKTKKFKNFVYIYNSSVFSSILVSEINTGEHSFNNNNNNNS